MCVCACGLSYPACNVNVPHCRLLPVPLYNTFSQYLINGTIFFEGRGSQKMCVFSLQLSSETFLMLRRTEQDMTIDVY